MPELGGRQLLGTARPEEKGAPPKSGASARDSEAPAHKTLRGAVGLAGWGRSGARAHPHWAGGRRARAPRRGALRPLSGNRGVAWAAGFGIILFYPSIVLLVEARKLTTPREILLWMTPSEAPKALQASECSELLDPTRASCWIFAQH